MSRKTILASLAALIVVSAGIWATAFRNDDKDQQQSKPKVQASSVEATKSATEKDYETYVGENYDRYYMANMIAHHQGAIDMAKLAQTNAKHTELKSMANEIVSAQSTEISSMTSYQQAWGYPVSSGEMMMDHSAMGMEDENASMMKLLEGKTGDAFDKAFLKQMIAHHTSAIAMSRPAAKNAAHQEVKTLAADIIKAQTDEINQMEQWQKSWGYNS